MDIAAEALRRDGVLLAVHFLAANDRCAAKVCLLGVRQSVSNFAPLDRCAARV